MGSIMESQQHKALQKCIPPKNVTYLVKNVDE